MRNLHNLDLLRAFAVVLVLIDHTSWALGRHIFWTWGTENVGVFGVYLFFVHTSLVLMWSLERQPHVLNFYIRRAFRIYPLALTALAVALIFRIPVDAGGSGWQPHGTSGSTILANALLVQDLLRKPNIVGVMWTLTIEVQMYIVLPLLFFYAYREKKIWPLLCVWLLTVVVVHTYIPLAGNILPTVAADFIPGVIAYVAFIKWKPVLPAWTFFPFLILLLAVYMLHPTPAHSWPVALALGLALPRFRQISNRFVVPAVQKIAMYSYGIYLWHSFGMKISFHYLAGHSGFVKVLGELAFTAVASIASYHLIESPLIKYGNQLARANDRREALA